MECTLEQIKTLLSDAVKEIRDIGENEDCTVRCVFYALDYGESIFYVFVDLNHYTEEQKYKEEQQAAFDIKVNTILICRDTRNRFIENITFCNDYDEQRFINIISFPLFIYENINRNKEKCRILVDPLSARSLCTDSQYIYNKCIEFFRSEETKLDNEIRDRKYYALQLISATVIPLDPEARIFGIDTRNPYLYRNKLSTLNEDDLQILKELSGLL